MADARSTGRRSQAFWQELEQAVAVHLASRGWDAQINAASRIVDIVASKRNRPTRYVQVKASEAGERVWPDAADVGRLATAAAHHSGVGVVALVKRRGARWQISYFSADTGVKVDAD